MAILAAALGLAPQAHASATASRDGFFVTVTGSAADDVITVSRLTLDDGLRISDPSGVTAGDGCEPQGDTDVVCTPAQPQAYIAAQVHGAAGNDTIRFMHPLPTADRGEAYGEGGNDVLIGDVFESQLLVGGPGDDRLEGQGANDFLDGGDGADALEGRDGDDFLDGGDGADVLRGGGGRDGLRPGGHGAGPSGLVADGADRVDGGDGTDLINYYARLDPLILNLSVETGWGAAGENDAVTGVENVRGGDGDDTISGAKGISNGISGGAGDDHIDTFDGDSDSIDCEAGTADYAVYDPIDVAYNCETRDEAARCGWRQLRLSPQPPPPPEKAPPCGPAPVAPPGPLAAAPSIAGPRHAGQIRVSRNGSLLLPGHAVSCEGHPAVGCHTTTSITASLRPHRARNGVKRIVALGEHQYATRPQTTTPVRSRLGASGRRQLRRRRSIPANVHITLVHHGEAVRRTVKVTLLAPRR